MAYLHIPGHNPQGPYWQGYVWSNWYYFTELVRPYSIRVVAIDDRPHFRKVPGIYRIRIQSRRGLLYIGETGRSVHGRLRGHMSAVKRARGQLRVPAQRKVRPFAKRLSSLLQDGRKIQASWTPLPGLRKPDRLGLEAELISAYRATVGKNPDLQFLTFSDEDESIF
jgi:hypothetical protein